MNLINERHRKELLRFLLLKTAPVRCGIKPGALLRVRHCYATRNAEGLSFCLYRRDIFDTLQLDYMELREERDSSLVLFFHPEAMCAALRAPENREILNRYSYPLDQSAGSALAFLKQRFAAVCFPHEVGVFIGYPAKDVIGFIENLPKTPIHKGDWQVFGDPRESVTRMKLYRKAERVAQDAFDACDRITDFLMRFTSGDVMQENVKKIPGNDRMRQSFAGKRATP